MTYPQAIQFLNGLSFFGLRLGLENTLALAERCGDPHRQLRFIHVAGTNGKGSTCALLESISRQAGLRTGLFTSPHLVSFTERIQVDRVRIAEDRVARGVEEMCRRLGGADPESWAFRPTFFEFVTVLALRHFLEERCDLVIWETGLGGRLDATNIVTPLASVITNVGLDHQQWLGSTVREIAAEKAGIIKPGVPVITAATHPEALEVMQSRALALAAPLTIVGPRPDDAALASIQLPLLGDHQRTNAALSVAALRAVSSLLPRPVTPQAIRRGLETVVWPGRLQQLRHGETEYLLDGAHNPDGARALRAALEQHYAGRAITLVFGVFDDKSWREICEILVPRARRLLLTPLESERGADPAGVARFCRERWPSLDLKICPGVPAALAEAAQTPFVLVTGSLHLIGHALELLEPTAGVLSERSLNEWTARQPLRHYSTGSSL